MTRAEALARRFAEVWGRGSKVEQDGEFWVCFSDISQLWVAFPLDGGEPDMGHDGLPLSVCAEFLRVVLQVLSEIEK